MVEASTPAMLAASLTAQVLAMMPRILQRTTRRADGAVGHVHSTAANHTASATRGHAGGTVNRETGSLHAQDIDIHQDSMHVLIFVTVSLGYLEFFFNWYQSALKVGITQFLVLAEDSTVFDAIR